MSKPLNDLFWLKVYLQDAKSDLDAIDNVIQTCHQNEVSKRPALNVIKEQLNNLVVNTEKLSVIINSQLEEL